MSAIWAPRHAVGGARENPFTKSPRSTYPLCLPSSVETEVERLAKAEEVSVNQFVASVLAEKLAAMNSAAFFAERRKRVDYRAFDRLVRCKGGAARWSGYTSD